MTCFWTPCRNLAYQYTPASDSDSETKELWINQALWYLSIRNPIARVNHLLNIIKQHRLQRNPWPQTQEPASRSPTPDTPTNEAPENNIANPQNTAAMLAQLQQDIVAMQNTINQQNQLIQNLQAPQPGPAIHVKPERPPPFTGKWSEPLEAWIFQIQQYYTLAQVPDADQVAIAATFFKDQATLWWRSYYQT